MCTKCDAALSFIIGNDDNNERRRSTQQVRYSFLHNECPDRYRQIDDDALITDGPSSLLQDNKFVVVMMMMM